MLFRYFVFRFHPNMSKSRASAKSALEIAIKPTNTDLNNAQNSLFTLTFVVELLGIDVWHDCNEGWLDLGPCLQGIKLTYQLYYGQSFDVDILIWPHTAKIWHGGESGWVRSWQFLEHRFIAFSIRHALPVRVLDLVNFHATVVPNLGLASLSSNAKNDKNSEVYLPKLEFGQRRYFAPVLETLQEPLHTYLRTLIWNAVVNNLPTTIFDGVFDVPSPVTDIRHQDAVIEHVQDALLHRHVENEKAELKSQPEPTTGKGKVAKRESKATRFELRLSGAAILAGTGRIMRFETMGERPANVGEIIALISSSNLPASDDLPVLFVNVGKLFDVPLMEIRKHRITQLYTRWILSEEIIHDSEAKDLKNLKLDERNVIDFNDHYAVPLGLDVVTKITATFLDTAFEIQLRGQRLPAPLFDNPKYFGYEKVDRDFGKAVPPKPVVEDLDPIIAVTKIDARQLAKCLPTLIRGEYPLFPPETATVNAFNREAMCTNDINAIGAPILPKLVIPSHVVLQAQMTLESSMGIVGCRPRRLQKSFSRMFALFNDSESVMSMLRYVIELNEELNRAKETDSLLDGFAIDTGDKVVFFMEGPRDGYILKVWGLTEDFYPKIYPIFSTSARYSCRVYPELIKSAAPFVVLKMYAPLGLILACPSVYARPALPSPTRSCVLKLGRIVSSDFEMPYIHRVHMPTYDELRSFRLELCAPPHPPFAVHPDVLKEINKDHEASQNRSRRYSTKQESNVVNWDVAAKTKKNPNKT